MVVALLFDAFTATAMGCVLPSTANCRLQRRFPWVTVCRKEHYELSLMVLAVALTVFASVIATAFVGLLFSLTPGEPWQTEGQQSDHDDGATIDLAIVESAQLIVMGLSNLVYWIAAVSSTSFR